MNLEMYEMLHVQKSLPKYPDLQSVLPTNQYELEDYLFILEQYLNKKSNADLLHKVKLAKKISPNKNFYYTV